MSNTIWQKPLVLLLISVLMLAACVVQQPTAVEEEMVEEEAASMGPPQGGTLRLMGHHDAFSLSPGLGAIPSAIRPALMQIHNGLVEIDASNTVVPVLAESYDISEDGLTYTFPLREGVKFHNGADFTCKDVKYTFDFYRDPENAAPVVGVLSKIDSVECVDDYTAVINMVQVDAAFLVLGAILRIVQSDYHAEVGEEVYATAPIGTGSFKLVEWHPSQFTLLEAFDDHFRGRPNLDFLRVDVVPEASVRTIALESGDADGTAWPLLMEDNVRLANDPRFTSISQAGAGPFLIPLNNTIPQLSDKRVRQALYWGLDRQRIIDDLWFGQAQVAHSNLSPIYPDYYNPDIPRYEYDPEKAMALLDEAGWVDEDGDGVREKEGERLSFDVHVGAGNQQFIPVIELAQQLWADIGVEIFLVETPVAAILDGMRKCEMDAAMIAFEHGAIDPDPHWMMHSEGANNFPCISNPKLDALIEEGLSYASVEQRRPIYNEIQAMIMDEAPVIELFFTHWPAIFNAKVKGQSLDAVDTNRLWREIHLWYIEEE